MPTGEMTTTAAASDVVVPDRDKSREQKEVKLEMTSVQIVRNPGFSERAGVHLIRDTFTKHAQRGEMDQLAPKNINTKM